MEQLAEKGSWIISEYSLLVYSWYPFYWNLRWTRALKQEPAAGVLMTWRLIAYGTSSLEMWFMEEERWWWCNERGVGEGDLRGTKFNDWHIDVDAQKPKEDIKFLHLNFSEPHVIGCRSWMTSARWLPLMGSLKNKRCGSKKCNHEALHKWQCNKIHLILYICIYLIYMANYINDCLM